MPSHSDAEMCTHGLVGFCPDCRPGRLEVGCDDDVAAPHAAVKRNRDGLFVVVQRTKSNGAFDWFTYHLTRRGARRAVDAYMRTGKVKGLRP